MAVGYTFDGDATEAAKWYPFALQLQGALLRMNGKVCLSHSAMPVPGVMVFVKVNPSHIHITVAPSGAIVVTFAPSVSGVGTFRFDDATGRLTPKLSSAIGLSVWDGTSVWNASEKTELPACVSSAISLTPVVYSFNVFDGTHVWYETANLDKAKTTLDGTTSGPYPIGVDLTGDSTITNYSVSIDPNPAYPPTLPIYLVTFTPTGAWTKAQAFRQSSGVCSDGTSIYFIRTTSVDDDDVLFVDNVYDPYAWHNTKSNAVLCSMADDGTVTELYTITTTMGNVVSPEVQGSISTAHPSLLYTGNVWMQYRHSRFLATGWYASGGENISVLTGTTTVFNKLLKVTTAGVATEVILDDDEYFTWMVFDGANVWAVAYGGGRTGYTLTQIVEADMSIANDYTSFGDYVGSTLKLHYFDGVDLWASGRKTATGNPAYVMRINPADGTIRREYSMPGVVQEMRDSRIAPAFPQW